jgi:hypothetical protein
MTTAAFTGLYCGSGNTMGTYMGGPLKVPTATWSYSYTSADGSSYCMTASSTGGETTQKVPEDCT